jgi:hypothetical protein
VTVDLSGASKLWFLSSASESTGGQFNVEIPFSFSGGNAGAGLTQGVASILIVVANDVGNSNGVQVLNP